jgi:hypothetical protein
MLHVDERRKRRLGAIVPLARRCFSARILRRRDNFEILTAKLFVNFLPARQIETAASPTRPGDHQHLLAAKITQMDHASLAIRHREIRRHARVIKRAAHQRNLAETVHA